MKYMFILLCVLIQYKCYAEESPKFGILYGDNHAFHFSVPEGWNLDTEVGKTDGLTAVMYLKDSTWADSVVIAYPRAYTKDENTNSIEKVYQSILLDLITEDKGIVGKFIETVMAGNVEGQIYCFSGQNNGTYEASVYYNCNKTVNYIVYSARSKGDFDKYYGNFIEMAKSYVYMGDHPMADK